MEDRTIQGWKARKVPQDALVRWQEEYNKAYYELMGWPPLPTLRKLPRRWWWFD